MLLAPRLQQFKERGANLWNFRCPICGDSQKEKTKTRGYIYSRKGTLFFMCHNCGASSSFQNFLKSEDPLLYKEYLLERYAKPEIESKSTVDVSDFVTKPVFDTPRTIDLPTLESLSDKNPAKAYLKDRQIPLKGLYYAEDFKEFLDKLIPDHGKTLYKEPRIIIPFYDKEGVLQGVQGRAIGPSKIKYITMKVNEGSTKLFGLNTVDTSKRVYVVEGPLDSLFLENCVATMDATLYHAIGNVGLDNTYTFVYDNEPRNKDIVKHMRKTIEMGREVCIWPSYIKEKDINEMVLAGNSPAAIQHIIDNNTYSGLQATMIMNQWSKV